MIFPYRLKKVFSGSDGKNKVVLGKGPKIKSTKIWSLTIKGGGGDHPKPNPYSDQFSWC